MNGEVTSVLGLSALHSDADALAFVFQRLAASHNHVQLVVVKAVKPAGMNVQTGTVGTVDVQPMVHQVDGAGKPTPHGTIHGLPYIRIQGGKMAVIMDPVVGDIGIAVFCDRDTSSARAAKKPSNPGSRRRFDWADGIYIGGLLNGAPQHWIMFKDPAAPATFGPPNPGITIFSPLPINIQGDLRVTGSIIAGFGGSDQIGLQTHSHTQGPDGRGDAEVPTNPPIPGS